MSGGEAYGGNSEGIGGRKKRKVGDSKNLRWKSQWTKALLSYFIDRISEGENLHKLYGPAAKHLSDLFGVTITYGNTYNHWRGWKAKWSKISKLRSMSDVGWDDQQKMILMAQDVYNTHIKAHPSDELFINKPIPFFEELSILCGDDAATRKFAKSDQQSAGVDLDDDIDSDRELLGDMPPPKKSCTNSTSKEHESMSIPQQLKGKVSSSKKKDEMDSKDVLYAFNETMKEVAKALRCGKDDDYDARAERLDEELNALEGIEYKEVEFTREYIAVAFDYLQKDPSLAAAFFRRSFINKQAWLYMWIKKQGW